jgi:hypothetical protein
MYLLTLARPLTMLLAVTRIDGSMDSVMGLSRIETASLLSRALENSD